MGTGERNGTDGLRDGGEGMKRIKIWKWEFVIVWDFSRFHVSKNPIRKAKYQTKGE